MRKPRVRWILLALFCAAIVWIVISSNPFAQGIRAVFGSQPDQPIMDGSFSVSPHSFRYYRFSLPEGSKNVALVGQFAASMASAKSANDRSASPASGQNSGSDIEVLVLSESEFARWQKGAATGSVYQSGAVTQGKVQQSLPDGSGVYYLVFSNRLDSTVSRKVNASAFLRHKSWLRP